MNIELVTALRKCDEVDLVELQHAMKLAAWLKDIEIENSISSLEMAKKLTVSVDLYKNMRNGSYPFDLRTIAKIEAVADELKAKRVRKLKTK